LAIPAARFRRIDAGGVLVMKVKERSVYTVITTGMINPAISLLEARALNCLQNSMMLICAWPNAGPTGGAGVALPAAIWSFTNPCTFFGAMIVLLFQDSAASLLCPRSTFALYGAHFELTLSFLTPQLRCF